MYTVGIWFVHLMNVAILAIVGIIVLVAIFVKKGQYQREAAGCIQAEIWQPGGWPEFYTVKCDMSAKVVTIKNFVYRLNPEKRRWGLHPRLPFMGLKTLQVPIRKEYWFQDITEPILDPKATLAVLTAAEIRAIMREGKATMAARHSQQLEAGNKRVIDVIANAPKAVYVYAGLGAIFVGVVAIIVRGLL